MAEPLTTYKLMILALLEHAKLPLSGTQISEFFLEKEYTNYFTVQEALHELDENAFIKTTNLSRHYKVGKEEVIALDGVSLEMYYCIQFLRLNGETMTMSELAATTGMTKRLRLTRWLWCWDFCFFFKPFPHAVTSRCLPKSEAADATGLRV